MRRLAFLGLELAVATALAFGCAEAATPASAPRAVRGAPALAARAWPAADALFRRDPGWLGADAAVSVALDGERVLWLFGDTFVAEPGKSPVPAAVNSERTRRGALFVRNSVGVQDGLDPSSATIRFEFGRAADGRPASFFADEAGTWFWPGSGVFIDGALTLFLERMRNDDTPGGLGFRTVGWSALRVRDPRGPPDAWRLERLATPDTGELGLVGVAVAADERFVYAYGVREPGDHALLLLRWTRAAFARGELAAPEYFGGSERGFGAAPGVAIIADGASEFSVSRTASGRYVQVQSRGFGAAPIALRFAPAREGPWSVALDVYRPEEAARPGVLLYAARAHPEQEAGGDLVITYASNTLDADGLLDDFSLYFPRFVRVVVP